MPAYACTDISACIIWKWMKQVAASIHLTVYMSRVRDTSPSVLNAIHRIRDSDSIPDDEFRYTTNVIQIIQQGSEPFYAKLSYRQ